jgi:SAM-dependent methyltransferase
MRAYFDAFAPERGKWKRRSRYYYRELERLCRFLIPEGSRVLEIGCGTGELLAAVKPSCGTGIDLSPEMVKIAREKHPHLRFEVGDAEDLPGDETFDYVILSDLVGHLFDVQRAFQEIQKVCRRETRVIITYYNFLWEPFLKLAEKLRLKMPQRHQNWLGVADICNLLHLAGFDVVKSGYRMLVPKNIPLIAPLFNRILSQIPGLRRLCLVHFIVARPVPRRPLTDLSCTVLIPCRNEKGNIHPAIERVPPLGSHTEIIFVDGNSTDGTVEEVERAMAAHPDRDIKIIHQGDGVGKGDAVRKGFDAATGDVLMILDADLTVPPEELPKFFNALRGGKGEFINGCRLVYPMEKEAMRTLNLVGNKFFGLAFTWLLDQRFKDTLCGTKVLLKRDYEKIKADRSYFGDFDPFGDFDLLFGAAKQNLKILEIPIRYRERTYGNTNISRFRHGWLLLKMCVYAYRKLKIV